MSYCRNPQYIYPRDEGIWFNGKLISDDEINTFVYVLLFKNRRSELKERLIKGKKEYLNQTKLVNKDTGEDYNSCINKAYKIDKNNLPSLLDFIDVPMSHNDPDYKLSLDYIKMNEDDLIKELMK